jgi:predicted TIM-barrel fold metal-dependent hydrolase
VARPWLEGAQVSTITDLRIIDADAHVIETDATWDYLEGPDRQFRPRLYSTPDNPMQQYWVVDDNIAGFRFPTLSEQELAAHAEKTGRNVVTPAAARELDDVSLRLAHLDQLGIDFQVLHNTLWIEQVSPRPEIDRALCRSWNLWMADNWKASGGRLPWSCVVPSTDFGAARDEMVFAKANGAAAVCLRPFEGDRIITDSYFYPLFEHIAEIDIPVVIHIANGSPILVKLFKEVSVRGGAWARFRVPTVVATYSLLTSDVPALFPTIKWGIIEASASWMPWLCRELQTRDGVAPTPEDNPFIRSNVWVTAELNDDLPYILNLVGDDCLLFGTDYGHVDPSSNIAAIGALVDGDDVPETSKAKILWDNPQRFYNLATST